MPRFSKNSLFVLALALAQTMQSQTMKAPDITKQPTLYVIPYAHLDTQWRWEFPQTISEYLLKTMRVNFYYIDKYPHYVFNWTGSNRYRLMKEYYPADYAKLKQYVAEGRWYPGGASVEENDVNLPSAESIFRQVLYGNSFYRQEFGKTSDDYMLPDCFGFPASLPTILAHAGVKGFSTQKLNAGWQPAARVGGPDSPEETPEGIPFNVGLWKGPDGESILAAFNPGGYTGHIRYDLSKTPTQHGDVDWPARIALDGKVTGVFADYHYVGTGDIGGATDEESVRLLEAMASKGNAVLPQPNFPATVGDMNALGPVADQGQAVRIGDGPVTVLSATSDQMFRDIKPEMTTKMPSYQGDLELINHSAGSLTSQAYHKRWNRENEILADAAEKSSVAAAWLGGQSYPQQRLNDAWTLVLAGQFHDSGAGTATPRAYEFTQNDDVIALNQFADVLTSSIQAVASGLDTKVEGIPFVVYNSLNIDREDVVEAKVNFPGGMPHSMAVYAPNGEQVPSQIEDGKVLFLAHVPSVGYAVYSVRPGTSAPMTSALKVTSSSLENAHYRVAIDAQGDISSVFDKSLGKELLSSPIRLAISTDAPMHWPAWNMDFDQEQAAPRSYVSGPVNVRITENGPVRVSVEVSRKTGDSTFAQTVSLSTGSAGERVEFRDSIDWKEKAVNLKAVFPLAATNKMATYNWEVGTIERPTAYEQQFEVGSHYWIDLTDQNKTWGATVLTDVKNGSDKPDDHTLRLTLLRTPGFQPGGAHNYSDQLNQDWGHHEILYGLAGHSGEWHKENTDWQAYRLSTPLLAFSTSQHTGTLGRSFSLLHIDNPDIRVLALKKAENSNDTILRMVELHGQSDDHVTAKFAAPIASATETNGQEEAKGTAVISNGALETSFTAYQPRTFALHLGTAPASLRAPSSQPVVLSYDLAASSQNDTKTIGGFDSKGDALPAEMLPAEILFNGVDFHLAKAVTGKPDAVVARGQTIQLPAGNFNRVYVLAASANGDQSAVFHVGDRAVNITVQDWTGFIGQWDTRQWKPRPETVAVGKPAKQVALRKDWAVSANHAAWNIEERGTPAWSPRYPEDYLGLTHGYIKPATLAWYVSHYHTPTGLNEPYAYSYLFGYALDVPLHARGLTLPDNANIRILAVSVAMDQPEITPAQPLYDTLK